MARPRKHAPTHRERVTMPAAAAAQLFADCRPASRWRTSPGSAPHSVSSPRWLHTLAPDECPCHPDECPCQVWPPPEAFDYIVRRSIEGHSPAPTVARLRSCAVCGPGRSKQICPDIWIGISAQNDSARLTAGDPTDNISFISFRRIARHDC